VRRLLTLLAVAAGLLFAAPAQAHFTDSTTTALRKAAVRECSNHAGYFWHCVPKDNALDDLGWGRYDPYINFYDHYTDWSGYHLVRVHYRVAHTCGCDQEGWAEWLTFEHGEAVQGTEEYKIWD
jgi:hypothetical protein